RIRSSSYNSTSGSSATMCTDLMRTSSSTSPILSLPQRRQNLHLVGPLVRVDIAAQPFVLGFEFLDALVILPADFLRRVPLRYQHPDFGFEFFDALPLAQLVVLFVLYADVFFEFLAASRRGLSPV